MKWSRYSDDCIRSDAGYCITRLRIGGKQIGRYIAWLGWTTKTQAPVALGTYDSADEAKTACDCHCAQKQSEETA